MPWGADVTQKQMYERSFSRPKNYFKLIPQRQWEIDDSLGILDWDGRMTDEETERFMAHYE